MSVEERVWVGIDVRMWVGVTVVGAVVGYCFQVLSVAEHVVEVGRDRLYPASIDVPIVFPYFSQVRAKDDPIVDHIAIEVPIGVWSHELRIVSIQDVMGTAANEVEEPGISGMADAGEVVVREWRIVIAR